MTYAEPGPDAGSGNKTLSGQRHIRFRSKRSFHPAQREKTAALPKLEVRAAYLIPA
jgi:hypothetical protein